MRRNTVWARIVMRALAIAEILPWRQWARNARARQEARAHRRALKAAQRHRQAQKKNGRSTKAK